jgi:hypothetical protein
MIRISMLRFLLFGLILLSASTVYCQQSSAPTAREKTRDRLGQLLQRVGPEISVGFRQSEKQPFNFVGIMKDGLTVCDSLEVVVGVTDNATIGFRIFPHYRNSYVNIDRAKDTPGLMKQLLRLSDKNFLYWGADESGDIFTGYTFTLESGFPDEAIRIVLRSIANTDKFIGEMRQAIDGGSAPGH